VLLPTSARAGPKMVGQRVRPGHGGVHGVNNGTVLTLQVFRRRRPLRSPGPRSARCCRRQPVRCPVTSCVGLSLRTNLSVGRMKRSKSASRRNRARKLRRRRQTGWHLRQRRSMNKPIQPSVVNTYQIVTSERRPESAPITTGHEDHGRSRSCPVDVAAPSNRYPVVRPLHAAGAVCTCTPAAPIAASKAGSPPPSVTR